LIFATLFAVFLGFLPIHAADQAFLDAALKSESHIVSLSMLAIEKSHGIAMRAWAADILAHHTPIGRGLDHLLAESKRDVPLTGYNSEPDYLEALASLKPDQFDEVVLHEMVTVMDERERLFAEAARRHSNQGIHALAVSVIEQITEDANGTRRLDKRVATLNSRGG